MPEQVQRPLTADIFRARLRKGLRMLKATRLVPGWPAVNLTGEQEFYVHPKCFDESTMVRLDLPATPAKKAAAPSPPVKQPDASKEAKTDA